MTNRFGFGLLMAGVLAATACGGDDDGGEASIGIVVPGDVFAGRSANVLISGNGTDWADGATVDFGDGITAGDVIVASPTALYVPIEVAADAALGPRTVTVDGDLTYVEAFNVVSPLSVSAVEGTVAQGSVFFVTINNLDFTSPFDTTSTGDGFFEPIVYTNLAFEAPEGVTISASSVQPYTLSATVLVDVDAAAGPLDLSVLSGPVDAQKASTFTGAFEIAAREAIALAGGAPVAGTIALPFDSVLYQVTAADKAIVKAAVETTNPDSNTTLLVLGASGSFDEFLGQDPEVTTLTGGSVYVVVWDNSGAEAIDYDVSAVAAVVGAATDEEVSEANDVIGQAQVVAAPITVNACELESDTDEDWYEIVVPAGADRAIGVATDGGAETDTVISVLDSEGGEIAGPVDISYHEALVTDPVAPGTYYVLVTNTGAPYTPSPGTYTLSIGLSDDNAE